MADGGSSVPLRALGRHLKQAREAAGVPLLTVADKLEISRARMYRIERGESQMRAIDVIAMCQLYGVNQSMTDALVSLAKEAKSPGWWHAFGDVLPGWFELYVGMEAAASRLRFYAFSLVPGLLQTREYAAAVIGTHPAFTPTEVDRRVMMRMNRQRLLTRKQPAPPKIEVILDESVLCRPIPDAAGMRTQLDHLAKCARLPSVTLRVLPAAAGLAGAIAGGFVILDFPTIGGREPTEDTTVYSQALTGAIYLSKPREVERYAQTWNNLCEHALSERESLNLLTAIKET